MSTNKAVKAGAGYLIGNYLLKGITFLSAPIFTRLLTTKDYGDVSTYLSYEAILYIIIGLALHSCVNNAKYKYGEKLNEFISSILTIIYMSLFIIGLFANLFYTQFSTIFGFSRTILNILLLHCFASALLQLFNTYVSLSYSYKSYLKITSFNALSNLTLSIVLILTLFHDDRTLGRIIGIALPMIIISVYIIFFFYRQSKPTINKDYFKFALRYSLPIIPHGISQVVLSSFDKIMIKNMVGSEEAGIYSFSYTIQLLLKVAVTSLENVWKPWLYEQMEKKDYTLIRKNSTQYVMGISIFTILILLVSPELIKVLGHKSYWSATTCVIPVLLGCYFAFLYTLPSLIEYYYEKTKFIALGSVVAAGLNVLLNLYFIPRYGYVAAAYTTLFTYFVYFLFHYIMARIIHGSCLFETKYLFLFSILVIAFGFVSLIVEQYPLIRIPICALCGAAYFLYANKHFKLMNYLKKLLHK